jgi:hypothetical protein
VIQLEHAMTYRLEVSGPLSAGRQFWQMSKATLEGPRIKAASAVPGIDWFTPLGEGYGRPHVRIPFRTDDDAVVLLEYHGLVHATPEFNAAVEHNTSTEWAEQYMRMVLFFETESPHYAWLRHRLFLARGRLLGRTTLEYDVYSVL